MSLRSSTEENVTCNKSEVGFDSIDMAPYVTRENLVQVLETAQFEESATQLYDQFVKSRGPAFNQCPIESEESIDENYDCAMDGELAKLVR